MPNHASATLIGHLGKDPEQRFTQDNKAVTTVSLGVSTGYKDKKKTTWWKVTCFGKTAEVAADILKKGHSAMFEGEPSLEEWEDKEGNKRQTVVLLASRLILLDNKKEQAPAAASKPKQGDAPFDDDIPF